MLTLDWVLFSTLFALSPSMTEARTWLGTEKKQRLAFNVQRNKNAQSMKQWIKKVAKQHFQK